MQKNKIQNIQPSKYKGLVYNIEVAEDNSYMTNAFIVHNCDPVSGSRREFKKEMFLYATVQEVKQLDTLCYITIDPAVSKKESADFTGFTVNWVSSENKWYFKSWKEKINSAELFNKLFELYDLYKPEKIGIEETTFTQALEPFLNDEMRKRNKYLPIVPLKHGGTNKEKRIRGLLPRYESSSIFHIVDECEDLEQEELRFPHSKHDDTCFIAGTKVLTDKGNKNIELVKVGDMVMTRNGYKEVLRSWCTGQENVITNIGLIGTKDHPIFTVKGIKELQYVDVSDTLYIWNEKQSSIMEKSITDTLIQKGYNMYDITGRTLKTINHLNHYIGIFGKVKWVQSLKDFMYTIKMAILSITQLIILNVFQRANMQVSTCNVKKEKNNQGITSRKHLSLQKNGTQVKKVLNGTKNMPNKALCYLVMLKEYVSNVVNHSKQRQGTKSHAVGNAVVEEVLGYSDKRIQITTKQKVYNLTIADNNEYFANNVLVHNCDSAAYQSQIAESPHTVGYVDDESLLPVAEDDLYSEIGL